MARREPLIIVVGAGIGGLVAALSLHEIGARVDVYESVLRGAAPRRRHQPPPARGARTRRVDGAGTAAPSVDRAGEPRRIAPATASEIWREPRGIAAGYPWPQLSIHRGVLQEVLLDAFIDRVGAHHLHLGHRLVRVEADDERARAVFVPQPAR